MSTGSTAPSGSPTTGPATTGPATAGAPLRVQGLSAGYQGLRVLHDVDLSVDGKKSRPVLVHSIQVNPINRRPIHVDLFAVRMTEELTVEVQLVPTGTAPATELGGTLVHPTSSVRVRALPDNLPETLHYDISSLADYETTITAGDVELPEGVRMMVAVAADDPWAVRIDDRVTLGWEPLSDGRHLPVAIHTD